MITLGVFLFVTWRRAAASATDSFGDSMSSADVDRRDCGAQRSLGSVLGRRAFHTSSEHP